MKVQLKPGDWIHAETPRGGIVQGRVFKLVATGVKLADGTLVPYTWIKQRMGPMTRDPDGTVRQNPLTKGATMKKPSPAQLAARKLFAQRAKSGAFKRKANPLTRVKRNSPSMATGEAPSARLRKRRAKTAKAPAGYYANPLSRVKVGSKSMATGKAPTKRLKARRAKTAKAPAGYYANPSKRESSTKHKVYVGSRCIGGFPTRHAAVEYGQAFADAHKVQVVVK